jgi:hypothetical protein
MADAATEDPLNKFVNPMANGLDGLNKGLQTDANAAGELGDSLGIPGAKTVGKVASTALQVGDRLGQAIFGPASTPGTRTEEVPANGVYKPTTGNSLVDKAVGGVSSAVDWATSLL